MSALEIQAGSTIMNRRYAVRVTDRIDHDPLSRKPGWMGLYIPLTVLEKHRIGRAMFIPDRDLAEWRHVPFEWRPMAGVGPGTESLEERYVWSPGSDYLEREVRDTSRKGKPRTSTAALDKCPTCGAAGYVGETWEPSITR